MGFLATTATITTTKDRKKKRKEKETNKKENASYNLIVMKVLTFISVSFLAKRIVIEAKEINEAKRKCRSIRYVTNVKRYIKQKGKLIVNSLIYLFF